VSVNLKKLLTDFFILMALTTNISFIVSPNTVELVIVVAMNLAATILKIGESRMLSAEQMAASLVADLHLVPALFFYALGNVPEGIGLAWGALAANVVSVVLAIVDVVLRSQTELEEY